MADFTRMSSLPTLEYCGGYATLPNHESVNAKRSTIFHEYLATGHLDDEALMGIPPDLRAEVKDWHLPEPVSFEDVEYCLEDAARELEVGLTSKLDYCGADHPDLVTLGHLDFAWPRVPFDGRSVTVVVDAKSSIWAAPDGANSLQIAAYGWSYAKHSGTDGFIPGVWDLSDGRYHWGDPVLWGSFEAAELGERIIRGATNRDKSLVTGPHCQTCWGRFQCPAHVIALTEDHPLHEALGPNPSTESLEAAQVHIKQLEDTAKALKSVVSAHLSQGGVLRSPDGKKRLVLVESSGRKSLDEKSVAMALGVENLEGFKKPGAPFAVRRWRRL